MTLFIVICRSASDPRMPDTETGYFCRGCRCELQVSSGGREQIADGGTPYCNECGFALEREMEANGANPLRLHSPMAMRQLLARLARHGRG